MRFFFTKCVLVASLLLLAACTSADERMTAYGIGSSLHAPGIEQATALQNTYFELICQQSGFVDDNNACDYGSLDTARWRAMTVQGMNDIDRRCDAYLAWLDNRKRTQPALLQEISDVGTATHSILTVSGVGPLPLEAVSVAFGLIRNSLVNYHSRLLMEVNSSTVNTIVLSRRNNFRAEYSKYPLQSRPDVVYVLQSYLRLCLPYTIEMDINEFSTLRARGIDNNQESVVSAKESLANLGVPRKAEDKIKPPPRLLNPLPGALTIWEKNAKPEQLAPIFSMLCLPRSSNFNGALIRPGIKLFEARESLLPEDGLVQANEVNRLRDQVALRGACDTSRYRNYYERDSFEGDPALVVLFKKSLNISAETNSIEARATEGDRLDDQTRKLIAALRKALRLQRELGLLDEEVDEKFELAIAQ